MVKLACELNLYFLNPAYNVLAELWGFTYIAPERLVWFDWDATKMPYPYQNTTAKWSFLLYITIQGR